MGTTRPLPTSLPILLWRPGGDTDFLEICIALDYVTIHLLYTWYMNLHKHIYIQPGSRGARAALLWGSKPARLYPCEKITGGPIAPHPVLLCGCSLLGRGIANVSPTVPFYLKAIWTIGLAMAVARQRGCLRECIERVWRIFQHRGLVSPYVNWS